MLVKEMENNYEDRSPEEQEGGWSRWGYEY